MRGAGRGPGGMDRSAAWVLSLPMPSLHRALLGLAVAGLACGVAGITLVATTDQSTDPTPVVVLALSMGWGFIGTGLYAWWRRPENRMGALMVLLGFTWFLGALSESDSAWIFSLGAALGNVWIGAFALMLVAFPTGVVGQGLERILVALGWTAAALNFVLSLVTAEPQPKCGGCPENTLLLWDSRVASVVLQVITGLVLVALLGGLCLVLVRRWRAAGPVQRRTLAPVLLTGAATAAGGFVTVVLQVAGLDRAGDAASLVTLVLTTALPFAFLLGLLRSSLGRAGAVSVLVERLRGESVRDALADALGDPSLALAYWLPDSERFVDDEGHPVTLPPAGAGRAVTEIQRDGAPVAAIEHDAALLEEPELVRAAGAAAALALENERLNAELHARYEDLHASRARLVATADAARRRIERDLHDGAQQRFVALALILRLARTSAPDDSRTASLIDEGIAQLTAGLAELRELARGIHPAVLSERGLAAALASLAPRAPVPVEVSGDPGEGLPPPVETAAYFTAAEALTNIARYAHATAAAIALHREPDAFVMEIRDDGIGGANPAAGSGLSGMSDRLAAVDGRLDIDSPPGRGTRLRARIPVPPASADHAPGRDHAGAAPVVR